MSLKQEAAKIRVQLASLQMEKRSGYVDGVKKDVEEKVGPEPRKQDLNQ